MGKPLGVVHHSRTVPAEKLEETDMTRDARDK
jgi:hypothetical protein